MPASHYKCHQSTCRCGSSRFLSHNYFIIEVLIMYPLFHTFLEKAEQILVLGSHLNNKNELYFSQIRLQNQNQSLQLADIQILLYF